jgi:hypothetical protein
MSTNQEGMGNMFCELHLEILFLEFKYLLLLLIYGQKYTYEKVANASNYW